MKIIDPGHTFLLNMLDGEGYQILHFVKRNDPPSKYPGNLNNYPGTQLQEVLRAMISRLEYLQDQAPACENVEAIGKLCDVFLALERRAHRKHGSDLGSIKISDALAAEPCKTCGHILCTWCHG